MEICRAIAAIDSTRLLGSPRVRHERSRRVRVLHVPRAIALVFVARCAPEPARARIMLGNYRCQAACAPCGETPLRLGEHGGSDPLASVSGMHSQPVEVGAPAVERRDQGADEALLADSDQQRFGVVPKQYRQTVTSVCHRGQCASVRPELEYGIELSRGGFADDEALQEESIIAIRRSRSGKRTARARIVARRALAAGDRRWSL